MAILALVGGLTLLFSTVDSDAMVSGHTSRSEVAGRSPLELAAVAVGEGVANEQRALSAVAIMLNDSKSVAGAERPRSLPSRDRALR